MNSTVLPCAHITKITTIAELRASRLHFGVPRVGSVPNANAIKFRIRQLEETACTLQSGSGQGAHRTVRIPENLQWVGEAVEQSPRRSTLSYEVALGISDRSLRIIIHEDLSFTIN